MTWSSNVQALLVNGARVESSSSFHHIIVQSFSVIVIVQSANQVFLFCFVLFGRVWGYMVIERFDQSDCYLGHSLTSN